MADKTYTLEIIAKGLKEVTRGMEKLAAEGAKVEGAQAKASIANKKHTRSQHERIKADKGASQSTSNSTKAFSKMAQGMEGTLVPAYAAVAANVFALTAAFGALSRAADLQILINASDELATTTGRNLVVVAKSMKELTGEAISLQEAMTNASLAASAGFDNSTIEELTKVARNASVALGRDMTDSLNRIFKGAIKAEPELLDELGIIVRLDKASRDYAAQLGRNVKTLTTFEKQTAVVNAVLAEGEKKFNAISNVDVNPYSQLAASFHDVAATLTNFISIPLAPFIGFLSDNIASLTSVLLIFGASILKTAFPALNKFSETIDTKMKDSVIGLESHIARLNKFKLNLLPQTEVQKVKASSDALKIEFQAIADKYIALGKPIPKTVARTLDETTSAAKRASAALQFTNRVARNIAGGGGSAINLTADAVDGLAKSANNVIDANKALDKSSSETTKKVATGFAGVGVAAANAGIAVTQFGINVVQSSFKSIAAVSAETSAWGALKQVITQTKIAATVNQGAASKVFGSIGAFAGGAGAALFKMIPILGTITIGWQILSGVFSTIKGLFIEEDIIKLNESLDKQSDALIKSAKAAKFYNKNLKDLPKTLDNVSKQLELQSNIIKELSTNLKEVVNDVELADGFGIWQRFIDYFGAGELDTFKEDLEEISNQLKDLDYEEEVNKFLADFGDISSMSATEARDFGNAANEMLTSLNKVASASKAANDTLLDGVEALGKSLIKVDESLPTLTAAEGSFINLNSILAELSGSSTDKFISAFNAMNDVQLRELGIEEQVQSIADNEAALKLLNEQLTELEDKQKELKAIQNLVTVTPEDISNLQTVNAQVGAFKLGISATEDAIKTFSDSMQETLKETLADFQALIDAQNDFAVASAKLKFEIAFGKGLSFEDRKQQSENLLNLELVSIEKLKKANSRKIDSLIADQVRLETEVSKAASAKESKDLTKSAKEGIDAQRILNLEAIEAIKAKITQHTNANAKHELKTSAVLRTNAINYQKELGIILKLQESGLGLYQEQEEFLSGKLYAAIVAVKEKEGFSVTDAKAYASVRLKELDDAHSLRILLKDNAILNEQEAVSRTLSAKAHIDDISSIIAMSRLLKDETSSRLDSELQLMSEISKAEADRAKLDQAAFKLGDTAAVEAELSRIAEAYSAMIKALNDEALAVVQKAGFEKYVSNVKELKVLQQRNKFGGELTKIQKQQLDLAKIKEKYSRLEEKHLTALIASEKKLNVERNRNTYLKSLKESAAAMNDLSDAMLSFQENSANEDFDKTVNAMQLMQTVGAQMGGEFGKLTKGFSTLSLAVVQYSEATRANTDAQGNVIDAQLQSNSVMNLAMNSLGAMAGAFDEGSTAAKVFTGIQQGVAIANAAAAVTEAGTKGDPYTAPARVAAMLSLMASVLGAFGVSGGSSAGATAPTQEELYKESIGSQGLVGRELRGNYLVDSIDSLVSIDTKLFSASRELQVTMAHLNDSFSMLAASIFTAFSGDIGASFDTTTSTTDISGGLANLAIDLGNVLDGVFTSLPVLGSITGGLSNAIDSIFGNDQTVNQEIIDSGLNFSATLQTAGDEIIGTLDALAFAYVRTQTNTEHTFGSDTVNIVFENMFQELDASIAAALSLVFDNIVDSVTGMVEIFAENAGGIDMSVLFSSLEGLTLGADVSLEGLTEDEATDAIGAAFTAMTEDMAAALFPFLENFRFAGEGLIDTLARLTEHVISVNEAFSITGTTLAQYTDIGDISETDINTLALNEFNAFMAQSIQDRMIQSAQAFAEGLASPSRLSTYIDAAGAGAEAFRAEALATWTEALIGNNFTDLEDFQDSFSRFASVILDESELATIAMDSATSVLVTGLQDLISQASAIDPTGALAATLSEGITSESLQAFYELGNATGAFAVNVDFATGEINTAGADLLGTAVLMGEALANFEDAESIILDIIEAIENLNNSYIEQISLFGQLGKDNTLLNLAFDYKAALEEAEETGSSLELVEVAYGLRRLEIVKDSYEAIETEIKDSMTSIFDSIVSISSNLTIWDDLAFSTIKINKLVDRLKKGTTSLNLDSLLGDTSEFTDFIDSFGDIIEGLSTEGPTSVSDEIALVDQLRSEIINKYELESSLIEAQTDLFNNLSQEINNFLDDLIISDLSPLTNFEKLGEATSQFLDNASNVFSEDETVAENAANDLLGSASSLLDIASLFYSIGPEYVKVFDLVTSTLGGIDSALLEQLSTDADPLVELTTDVVNKLNVLDDILLVLQASNEDTYFSDIAGAITEGMLPLIGDVTAKLQDIDDGSWTTMIGHLGSISSSSEATLLAISAGAVSSTVDTLTGDISSFAVGTPNVPNDMVANIHRGEAIVPESMAEGIRNGELTLGQQDNTDVVNAIRELTGVLAISQEDLVDVTNRNMNISREIADNINQQQNRVKTTGVL